jgi:hypothetical protein
MVLSNFWQKIPDGDKHPSAYYNECLVTNVNTLRNALLAEVPILLLDIINFFASEQTWKKKMLP